MVGEAEHDGGARQHEKRPDETTEEPGKPVQRKARTANQALLFITMSITTVIIKYFYYLNHCISI